MTTERTPHIIGKGFRWFFLYAILLLLAMVAAKHAGAQTPTFTASPTTGESPLTTVLTWDYPGAASCVAGGVGVGAGWAGALPASGTRNMSGVRVPMTLTLTCNAATSAGKVLLKWTPPTQNTDGTAITNLGGYAILYGNSPTTLTQTIALAVPGASAYTVEPLAAGSWSFALVARTSGCFATQTPPVACAESVRSNVTTKAVTIGAGVSLPVLSVTLTPFTVPLPPTALMATDAQAYDIRPSSTGALLAQRVGVVKPGTACDASQARKVGSITYYEVSREALDLVNFSNGADKWVARVWARCS